MDAFFVNKKVQVLILTLLKNMGKGFLLLKNSRKTFAKLWFAELAILFHHIFV